MLRNRGSQKVRGSKKCFESINEELHQFSIYTSLGKRGYLKGLLKNVRGNVFHFSGLHFWDSV